MLLDGLPAGEPVLTANFGFLEAALVGFVTWKHLWYLTRLPAGIYAHEYEIGRGDVYRLAPGFVPALGQDADPDFQRRGIASRLLERLFELTGEDDGRGYTLEVRVSNKEAIKLYEKLGFERHGIRRGYYTDNREDALIMWKDPCHSD